MPKAICPACVARCSVTLDQLANRVVCPNCGGRFTAVEAGRTRKRVYIAAGVVAFAVIAAGVVAAINKEERTVAAKTTPSPAATAPALDATPVVGAVPFPEEILRLDGPP